MCAVSIKYVLCAQVEENPGVQVTSELDTASQNTSELAAGLARSANRGRAVAIGGAGSQGVAGDHPNHGEGGLGGALEQVHGLHLATTRDQSEALPRARGEDGGERWRRHDDGLGADGRTCDRPLIGSLEGLEKKSSSQRVVNKPILNMQKLWDNIEVCLSKASGQIRIHQKLGGFVSIYYIE